MQVFDDHEEDLPLPLWVAALRSNKYAKKLSARALNNELGSADPSGTWQTCSVLDWNADENKFFVEFHSNSEGEGGRYGRNNQGWVERLELCFDCEDPTHFADRVAAAYIRRDKSESAIRFGLYVRSMPSAGVSGPPHEWLDRITNGRSERAASVWAG